MLSCIVHPAVKVTIVDTVATTAKPSFDIQVFIVASPLPKDGWCWCGCWCWC